MDDDQRQPNDSDRDGLVVRIKRASDEGRIGTADRDIRLENVRSATSMAELDLMTRELDQLDAALPPSSIASPGVPAARPWSKFQPSKKTDDDDDEVADTPTDTPTSTAPAPPARARSVAILVTVAIAFLAAIAVFIGFLARDTDTPGSPGSPGTSQPGDTPGGTQTDPGSKDTHETKAAAYSLTATGIRDFLQTYRKRFGTSQVVELTLYEDYAIVGVPVPGKARQQSWLYRRGPGWTSFGDVRAVFPGSQVVNTKRLAIQPLVRNIRRAKARLNVEQPRAYVIVRFIRPVDQAPSVDVHVTNKFNESGYLATTLDGRVERAYPYCANGGC